MKNKIHILLVIWHPIGGIRTFLRYVYGQFSPEQYKLTVLLPETSELDVTREDLALTDALFEVLPPQPSIFSFMARVDYVIKSQRIDIVHSQGLTSGILTALFAKLRRTPHIVTSHGVLKKEQFEGFQGHVKKAILSCLLAMPDMIHSVSNDAQGNLLDFFPRLKKQSVISNGIDPKRFLIEERTDLKGKIGLSEETFLVGFFGRFMPAKGFDVLVDAVEIIDKQADVLRFSVVAFGWGGFIREEQEAIEHRGLKKYFTFLPFEPNVAHALRGVDVVTIPSRWEACPLLPMEALVAGVPVIGTDCLGLREVLQNTPGKIIPSGNAEALAQALLAEIRSPPSQIIASYRNQAAKRFDVQKQADALKHLIGKLSTSK